MKVNNKEGYVEQCGAFYSLYQPIGADAYGVPALDTKSKYERVEEAIARVRMNEAREIDNESREMGCALDEFPPIQEGYVTAKMRTGTRCYIDMTKLGRYAEELCAQYNIVTIGDLLYAGRGFCQFKLQVKHPYDMQTIDDYMTSKGYKEQWFEKRNKNN